MILDLQKASMWKRISAALFDGILFGILMTGLAFVLSLVLKYDDYNKTLQNAYDYYEAQYGVTFDLTAEEYQSMSEAEWADYNEAYDALIRDDSAMHAYNMVVNLTLVIVTVSILLTFCILEFAVPLFFGNGQTLGKKIFGIALMRTDSVKVTAPLLFIRTILGKFTIETMIPVLILLMIFFNTIGIPGIIILGLILLLQVILIIATHTNSLIHDILAKTVVVDAASQMIFDSEEDMVAYKKKLQAEKVAREDY